MSTPGEREHSVSEGTARPTGTGVARSTEASETADASETSKTTETSDTTESSPVAMNLTRSDERVLEYLSDAGADYPALIAGNTGLHVPVVERSVETMVEDGLVERVSGEVVYRITAAGRDALGR
ncbi:DUF2250 domain-containing protein [Halorubrum gandharaense]